MASDRTVEVGRASAHKRGGGGKVWWDLFLEGKQVGTMPDAQFQIDGRRALEAYSQGKSFEARKPVDGRPMTPEEIREQRGERLEHGANATLQVDDWTRYLARQELDAEGSFHEAVHRYEAEQWPTFERELFASLYANPEELAESERAKGSEWMAGVLEEARGLGDWQALRKQSAGDPWACGIAAGSVTRTLAKTLDKELKQLPAEDPARLEANAEVLEELCGDTEPTHKAVELAEKAAAQATLVASALAKKDATVRGALRAALVDAAKEIAEVTAAVTSIGGGPGVASACSAPRDAIRKALASNPRLRSIANIAGRMKSAMRQKQRTKKAYTPEQIVDVELGAEINRLLPSEVMLLASEQTELLLMKRILERNALQYRLEGTERLDRGPVCLLVDGSGSMKGLRHEWAMGLALALMDLCAAQRRSFALVHFDQQVQKTYIVKGKVSLEQLIEMVCYFSNGGTNFAPPLAWARKHIGEAPELQKADVILLTDGGGGWDSEVSRLKEQGAAVYGVSIQERFSAEQKAELAGVAEIAGTFSNSDEVELVFGI